MTDKATIDLYDSRADDYARMVTALPELTALKTFIAKLPPNAHVLDLGCGPGQAARAITQAGHTTDPVDASATMVQQARAHNLPARQASFADITQTNHYDGIWANFSLLHAPKSDLPDHRTRLHRALKPGGLLHLGMKTGTGERRDALGRFYAFYTIAEMTALLTTHGFTLTDTKTGSGKGLAGTDDPWCLYAAHA